MDSKELVYLQAMPGGSHDNPAYVVVFVGPAARLDAAQQAGGAAGADAADADAIADGGAAAAPPAP